MTKPMRGGASRARGAGEASFERLTQSVEAAQAALKDLRTEMSKGTRDVLKDLDMTLRDARRNLRSMSKTVTKDLDEIQHALAGAKRAEGRTGGGPRKTAASASAARKTTTARPTARKKPATAKTTARAAKGTTARATKPDGPRSVA